MKKSELLNQPMSSVIAGMGHTDTIAIGDCGLPIPDCVTRIDLALVKGIPTFMQVLEATLSELHVEKVIIASEMSTRNPSLYTVMQEKFSGITIEEIPHEEFKARTSKCKAVIRTGEYCPYANIILQSGVTF